MRAARFVLLLTAAMIIVLSASSRAVYAQDVAPAAQPLPEVSATNPFEAQSNAIEMLQRGQREAVKNLNSSQLRATQSLQRGERQFDDDAGTPTPFPNFGVRTGGGEPQPAPNATARRTVQQPSLNRFNPNFTAQDYLNGAGPFSYMGPRFPVMAGGGRNLSYIPPTSMGFVSDGMGGVTPAFGGMLFQSGYMQQSVGYVSDGLGGYSLAPYIIPPVTFAPADPNGHPLSNYPYSNSPLSQTAGLAPVPNGLGALAEEPIFASRGMNGVIPPDPIAEQAALENTGLAQERVATRALDQPDDNREVNRAIRAFRERRYREALQQLDIAIAAAPLDGSIELLRAQTLFAQMEFDQAASALDRALATLPSAKWDTVLAHGESYYQEDKLYSRQLDMLTGHVRKYPKDAAAHYLLGYHLGFQGRTADAVRELETAMSLGRRDPQTVGLYATFDQEVKRQAAEAAETKGKEEASTDAKNAAPVRLKGGNREF